MWFTLALLSAITVAARQVRVKQLLSEYGQFKLSFAMQALSLPFILAVAVLGGQLMNPFGLGPRFWVPTLIVSFVFFPLCTFLYTQAVKHGELSKVLPIQSLRPFVAMAIAWIFLSETPSRQGILAVAIIVLAIYTLHLKQGRLHNPLRPFMEERHSLYMLLNVISTSAMITLDKMAVQESNAVYYSLVNTVVGTCVLYAVARLVREPRMRLNKRGLLSLANIGTMQGITSTAYLMALAIGPIAYVTAIRGTSILMSSTFGIIYLKEALTKPKIAALVLISIGSLLLAFA